MKEIEVYENKAITLNEVNGLKKRLQELRRLWLQKR